MPKACIFFLICFWCCSTNAEPVELAPGLIFSEGAAQRGGLHVKLEVIQSFTDEPVLVGREAGRLAYFVSAVPAESSGSTVALWRKLQAVIKAKSDTGRFSVLREGRLTDLLASDARPGISYKVFDYPEDGARKIQVFYLLTSASSRYWVTATTVVVPELHSTLKSTHALVQQLAVTHE